MSKTARLVLLLEEYRELQGSAGGGYGKSLNGDAILLSAHAENCRVYSLLRCSCWRRSLTELERALRSLKDSAPVHHAHLVARHLWHERMRRRVWFRYGRWQLDANERVVYPDLARGHTPPTQEYDAVVIRWRKWVDLLIVAQALELLATEFRGEVWLPDEKRREAA